MRNFWYVYTKSPTIFHIFYNKKKNDLLRALVEQSRWRMFVLFSLREISLYTRPEISAFDWDINKVK